MDNKETKSISGKSSVNKNPSFLRDDYSYKSMGEEIGRLSKLKDDKIYEIKCNNCEMSVRSQGKNIIEIFERLKESGCIGCKNKDLVVKMVDMSGYNE